MFEDSTDRLRRSSPNVFFSFDLIERVRSLESEREKEGGEERAVTKIIRDSATHRERHSWSKKRREEVAEERERVLELIDPGHRL